MKLALIYASIRIPKLDRTYITVVFRIIDLRGLRMSLYALNYVRQTIYSRNLLPLSFQVQTAASHGAQFSLFQQRQAGCEVNFFGGIGMNINNSTFGLISFSHRGSKVYSDYLTLRVPPDSQ